MPLVQCPACQRFFKATADHRAQGPPDECPGCKTARDTSPAAAPIAPIDEHAPPFGCRSLVLLGIAALIGQIICLVVSPWMRIVVPMAIASAVLGFVEPRRPWRWGLAIVGSPLLILLATAPFEKDPEGQEVMHLWPLQVVFLVVFGGACVLVAYLGALLRHLVARPPTGPSPE